MLSPVRPSVITSAMLCYVMLCLHQSIRGVDGLSSASSSFMLTSLFSDGTKSPRMVRIVRGTKGTKTPRVVRKIHGTKRPRYENPPLVRNVYGTNSLWYEKSGSPFDPLV